MSALISGVGLGAAGAVGLLDGEGQLLDVRDLPVLDDGPRARPSASASGFALIVRELRPERAAVEFVSSRPTGSPMSSFALDRPRSGAGADDRVVGGYVEAR